MKKKSYSVILHVFCSLVFLFFPILSSPDFPDVKATISNPFGVNEVITHCLLLAFFYLSYFVLIPKLYFRQKYLGFGLSIIAYMILMILVLSFIFLRFPHLHIRHNPPPNNESFGPSPHDKPFQPWHPGDIPHVNLLRVVFFDYSMYLLIIVLFIAMLLKISQRWRQLQNEKLETELSYLKAQINPHFLFNTLNSIYALAIEKSDYTATAVVKLSGMMRYIISESNKHFVSLQKEINYIEDYIELQKFRLGNTVHINYRLTGAATGKEIAPLLLITFVENAFKYGVNPEKSSAIFTEINIENDSLSLMVVNNKVSYQMHKETSEGLGIKNTKHRLEMLYPGRYSLDIDDGPQKFIIHLQISLK
ncbi:sensor histidine kinase [Taibaiella lutea]|uniref:Sensor histidine kinase n=1 Tax=Taibaiella lutea TaxID=2608001 RepID=A0A5M6CEM5_9BACT|nr:sensor histidine kinase [Taibaiella lutea]KAA5533507.1 sensor histidine kinase [Taibaiella lutea]